MFLSSWQQKDILTRKRNPHKARLATIELDESWDVTNSQATDSIVLAIELIIIDDARDNHAIAHFQIVDLGANGVYYADDFVAHGHWRIDGNTAVKDVEIGP